jgi:DNA-binding winged helix-turn-helix (wHTH) protein/Tfp pilus assembly protein PilF
MSKLKVGDDLVLDPDHRSVHQNGTEIKLSELSYRLLLILIENAPNIVSHDRLINAVWQDRVVSDENLKKRVSRLRLALSDEAESPRYIVAERGMGYRCTAPVIPFTNPTVNEDPTPRNTEVATSLKRFIKSALLILFLVIAAIGLILSKDNSKQEAQSIGKTGDFTAKDYVNKGTNYYYRFKPDDNDTAIMLYKQSIELDPNFSPAYSGLANAYAQGYYQFGREEKLLQQSIELSLRSIEIEPNQASGYKSLGLALHLSGRYDESLNAYNSASFIDPNWAAPVANSALVNLERGHLILAYENVIKSMKMDLKDPIPYSFLAYCYRELGMIEHAKKAMEKSLALKPDYLLAQNYFAEFLLFEGHYNRAQMLLTKIIEQAPTNQFNHWINAQLHIQTGNFTLAKISFQKIAKIGGRYTLPAKINLAALNKNKHQLVQLEHQLDSKIQEGNQWAELIYSKGLIMLAQNNIPAAIITFDESIKAGMNHSYRFKNHPLIQGISTSPELKRLLELIESKNRQQRQTVIKLEKSNVDFL